MPTFEQIQQEYANIMTVPIEALTPEQLEIREQYAAELREQRREKVDNVSQFLILNDDRADAREAEGKRLIRSAANIRKHNNWIRQNIIMSMQERGQTKVPGNAYAFSIRENKIVYVQNEKDVPQEYWREKTERSVDKIAIRDAIAEGAEIPGCRLVPTYSLRVK